jgi:hypothetical protein
MDDHEFKYKVFSPIFKNLEGKKAIYHERYPRIIKIQDVVITPEHFEATAVFQTLIEGRGRYVPIEKWIFGASWYALHISGKKLVPYCTWLLWIDDDIVEEVERLTLEKKFDEAIGLLDYWSK